MTVTKLTNVDFDNITLLGIEEVYGFSRKDKSLLFAFDQPKSGELNGNNDVTYVEGKRGVRLGTLKRNKTTGFNCENAYVVYSALAHQWGSEVEEASETNPINVRRAELLTADDTGVTLSAKPVEGSLKVYETNEDKTKKAVVEATNSDADVTITDVVKGETYLCVYDEAVSTAKRIINDGEKFSEDVELVINLLGQDICSGLQYLIQCRIFKAAVSGEWSLSFGSDPSVHNFSAEGMLDTCSGNTEISELILC